MMARHLGLVLLVAVGCGREPSEEPFLTPPPQIPAPEVDAAAADGAAAAPTPTPPAPQPPTPAAPPAPAANNGPEIRASHVLVMYRGSRMAPPSVTRTQAEARARAEDVVRRARHG